MKQRVGRGKSVKLVTQIPPSTSAPPVGGAERVGEGNLQVDTDSHSAKIPQPITSHCLRFLFFLSHEKREIRGNLNRDSVHYSIQSTEFLIFDLGFLAPSYMTAA